MSATSTSPTGPSLAGYVQMVRRRRRVIAAITLLTVALALVPALFREPVYASSASIQISSLVGEGVFDTSDGQAQSPVAQARDVQNEIQVLRSRTLAAEVESSWSGPLPEYDGPEVEQVDLSDVIDVTIRSTDAGAAAALADAYARALVDDRRVRAAEALEFKADELREQAASTSSELESVLAELAQPGLNPERAGALTARSQSLTASIQDFNRRADQLDVEGSLRGRGTRIISPARLDGTPERASFLRTGVLSTVLGLCLGLAVAAVVDATQDKLGSGDELADLAAPAPLVATIPRTRFSSHADAHDPTALESFRYLRTSLQLLAQARPFRTIVVTSATAGEGKSVTAANIARAVADGGERVVLVDCDLRRPSLHRVFSIPNEVGVSTVLAGGATAASAVHFVGDRLAVLPAGPAVADPADVLTGARFGRLLHGLADQADLVVLDSPPVLPVPDALVLAGASDGVLVVARIDAVRRRAVRELQRRLGAVRTPVIGYIANDVPANDATYSSYGYGDDAAGAGRSGAAV